MSNNLPLYNVNDYTDVELYNILDLVNPTDRELEAKILMQVHKYENIGTKSAQKLARFFDDIYNHFFETEEDGEAVEGYANQGETFDEYIGEASKKYQMTAATDPSGNRRVNRAAQSAIDANIADSAAALDPTRNKPPATNNMMTMADKSAPQTQTVGYTQNLSYTKGKLNPILQQTTKRIISIDSQYRSDKRTMSTAFTFNLSEPLKDVVSLKLYSVQIPYTWYTIVKAYGNNFFYIKGRTSGIDSGSGIHDIEVSIAPGNYSPAELIGAVNNSIAALKKSRTDISLGNTALSYNYNTSLTTANIDLKNGYNQSSYVINFNNNAIPNYLGFIQREYSIRTLRSRFDTYDISSSTFNVTQNNNYFTIKLYEDNFTTLKSSFNIVIDTGAYTRSTLINQLKTTLSKLTGLTNTDCSISAGGTYIDLTLQPSRLTNAITINTKTQIVFYDFQYYNVDFTNTIFTNGSRDISGNIGNTITGNISLIINPALIDESGQIIIPPKQLLCKIKTKFYNGNSTMSYNNEEIFHEIKSAFNTETTYNNLSRLYSDLATAFTSYEYAGIKIFAGTTVASNGTLSLSVVADDRIWTNLHGIDGTVDLRSCFGFEREINNMNETTSELPATEQSGDYTIYTEPFVYFTPNNALYRDGLNGINDLSFSVPNSSATGSYKLNDYINVINQSIRNYDLSHNNVFNSQENAFNNTTAYPFGTHAYLQNNIFQLHVGISKIFDESMYIVDLSGSIFDNTHVTKFDPSNLLNTLSIPYQTDTDNANIAIDVSTIVFTLKPKLDGPLIYGNKNEPNVVIRLGDITDDYLDTLPASKQMDDIINDYIQPLFAKYTDPLSNINILESSVITATTRGTDGFRISLKVDVKKTLLAKDYRISFNDATAYNFTWNANLKISTELLNNKYIDTSNNVTLNSTYKIYDNSKNLFYINETQVDTSGNIRDISENILDNNGKVRDINNNIQTLSGRVMYTVIPNGNIKISGISAVPQLIPIDINVINNTFSFKAVDDGVATSTALNDVIITIPAGKYFRDTLINVINAQLRATSTRSTIITGTEFSIVNRYNNYYTSIVTNLKREYTTSDYNLVFYDKLSFATCTVGTSSVQNTTWDTTIGWIMGFREYTTYDMSAAGTAEDTVVDAVNGNVITIIGDTGLSTNLYNYFLICLDDFNQNHLNDGLVTITNVDTSIPLPSYASRTDFVCDPVTGQKVYNVSSGLTERQIYAAQAAANSRTINESIGSSISANSYGSGPFVSDVFGIIPMKVSGLANGSSYVEFGGTLQNQERSYFGPVNIHRMSVRLVTDRGNLVDLNKANWSFSLVCEQLNKLDPGSGK